MTNQLIRNIQIDLILSNPNPIIDWFNSIWKDLSIIEVEVYNNDGGEFIYKDSNNDWIFYRNDVNDFFWCSYERFWVIFESKHNLKYQEIQDLTKILVEQTLHIGIATAKLELPIEFNRVAKTLNNKYEKSKI